MNINRIQKIRSQLRTIKYLVSDNTEDISDMELSVIYNDISKVNDILLDKLMVIQNEYEHNVLVKDCVIDRNIAFLRYNMSTKV